MAEVTPTIIDASFFPVPGAKAFEVTANDGDHFIARGMSDVKVAIAVWAEDPSTGNPVAGVISDKTKVTIECTGASGKKFQVICIGR